MAFPAVMSNKETRESKRYMSFILAEVGTDTEVRTGAEVDEVEVKPTRRDPAYIHCGGVSKLV
jgi:hypothetical protein